MKIILLIAIPLALIIGLGIYAQNMLHHDANEITTLLDQLEVQVSSENWEKASASIDHISKTWLPVRRKWEALIDHFETDRIDETFSRLKAYIQTEEDEECMAEIAALKQSLLHIPELEKLSLSNIF